MLQNSSKPAGERKGLSIARKLSMVLVLSVWVFVCFVLAQLLVSGGMLLLQALSVPLTVVNQNVLTAIMAAFVYLLTLGLVIGLPTLLHKDRVTLKDLGADRLPKWIDILITPVGLIVYLVLSAIVMLAATTVLPWFDSTAVQDTGFGQLVQRYDYILAFVTLVIIAPIAEEILFRGYLFGRLRRYVPIWVAIVLTSVLFGFIHGAWNIAIDTFALSIVLCLLRLSTGSLWAPILLHMTKNGIAFYLLFINPMILNTLGG